MNKEINKNIDGKKIGNDILDLLKSEVCNLDIKPNFVVIQVEGDQSSDIYIKQKEKMANYVGYGYRCIKLDRDITTDELVDIINQLNNDKMVNGILVHMPLPSHIDKDIVQNAIVSYKDIDGLSDINSGRLFHDKDCLYSCTPYGIMELLKRYEISLEGKHVVIVGRSNLVGKPMSMMLLNAGATVTVCHSKTVDLEKHTRMADIIIVAVGKANFINGDMVKKNAILVDVGINRIDGRICGDIDYASVIDKVRYITPVPGGVGPMTVAMLGMNILKAYKIQKDIK